MNSFNIKECYTLLVEFLCFYYYDLIKICFWSVNKCHTMHLIYAFNTILKAKIRKYTCRVQVKQTNPFVLSQYCYNFIILYVAIQADAVFENILYVNTKCTLEYVCTYLAKLTALLIFLTTSKRSDVNNSHSSFLIPFSVLKYFLCKYLISNLSHCSQLTVKRTCSHSVGVRLTKYLPASTIQYGDVCSFCHLLTICIVNISL